MSNINHNVDHFSSKDEQGHELETNSLFDRASKMVSDYANFSSILRIFGAIAVLISMSMFLMQGWVDTNDFERFCIMLSQTFLLGTAGVAMVKLLKEVKGARLFFGLSLVSIAANFTTLGALIYSVFAWDNLAVSYPAFALWKAGSAGTALLSTGIAIIVLLPFTWLAFSALARPAATRLTVWYAGANLLLLLPVRDVTTIVVIVALASVLLVKFFIQKNHDNDVKQYFSWNTKEGKFARLILFVPLIIMTVRSVLHYQFDSIAILMICISVYALLVYCARIFANQFSPICLIGAMTMAATGAFIIAFKLHGLPIPYDLQIPTYVALFTVAAIDLSTRGKDTWMQNLSVYAIAFVMTSGLVINHLALTSVLSVLSAVVAASFMLFYAYQIGSKILAISGLMLFSSIPVFHFSDILSFFVGSGWIGFAVGGVGIIVLASLFDRYGAIVQMKLSNRVKSKLEA